MPELPEVETIRRQLAPAVEGAVVRAIEIEDARWCAPLAPGEVAAAVRGRRVVALRRRGKYLIWDLDDEVHLLMHLRMTGALLLDPVADPAHARVRIDLDRGPARRAARVVFDDPRRFGTGELALGDDALAGFLAARLGPEPFDEGFGGELLRLRARGRTAPVKAFLLDQRRVAGIGNIYADEALFRAKVHPLRPAGRLTRTQWDVLARAVLAVLEDGIDARGASIDDFRHVDGVRGAFQDRFRVHRREGEPCPECATEIVKLVAAGRGTYVCPSCQRPPRRRVTRSARRGARSA